MSHLLDEINLVNQNTIGNLSLNIDDVNDITISSVQTNDMIEYSSSASAFVNTTSDSLVKRSSYPLTKNVTLSTASNYSPTYLYLENPFYWCCKWRHYSTTLMDFFNNSQNEVLSPNQFSGAGYIDRIEIKANKPTLLFCFSALSEDSPSTSYLDLQWQTDGGTALGPITRFKILDGNNRNTVVGYINSNVDVDVGLKRITRSGNYGWMTSTQSLANFIMIAKRVF